MKFNSFGLYPSCFLKTLTKLKKMIRSSHFFLAKLSIASTIPKIFDPFTKVRLFFTALLSRMEYLWITAKKPLLLLFDFYKR